MRNNKIKLGLNFCLFVVLLFQTAELSAQKADKSPLRIALSYFSDNNWGQYISVTAKTKVEKRFQPVKGADVKVFLDKDSSGKVIGYIGKVTTDEKGRGALVIPPGLAAQWKSTASHTFVAMTENTKQFDESSAELVVNKARILVDTMSDKNVEASVSEYKNGDWIPVKGVEIKLAIKRLGGDLPISDDQSFTTDSTGKVKGEFKRLGIPGDEKGFIKLVAKVEDNDLFGNLCVEKSVPWGKPFTGNNDFFIRSLWGSQFHSPLWLVVMAYTVVILVWGTMIYLVILLLRIRKLGRKEEALQ